MKRVLEIPINKIKPDPNQPRKKFNRLKLEGLAKAIKTEGLVNPIEIDGDYMIIHGERRWRASKIAGLKTVRAIINRKKLSPFERLLRQCVENAHHSNMSPIDTARAWKFLANHGVSKEKAGKTGAIWLEKKIGVSQAVISQYLALLKEPLYIQKFVENEPKYLWWLGRIRAVKEPWRTVLRKKMTRGDFKNRNEVEFVVRTIKKYPERTKSILDEYKKKDKEKEVTALVAIQMFSHRQHPMSLPELVLKLEKEMITFEQYMGALEDILPDLPEQSKRKLMFSLLSIFKKVKGLINN